MTATTTTTTTTTMIKIITTVISMISIIAIKKMTKNICLLGAGPRTLADALSALGVAFVGRRPRL